MEGVSVLELEGVESARDLGSVALVPVGLTMGFSIGRIGLGGQESK